MKVDSVAGRPADPSILVNVPKLATAYYAHRPDPFRVQVFVGDLESNALSVELYAEGQNGQPALRYLLSRRERLVSSEISFGHTLRIPTTRPAADYTPRVIPFHAGASVPLEAPYILWHDSPSW